jgi:hypothetical protein
MRLVHDHDVGRWQLYEIAAHCPRMEGLDTCELDRLSCVSSEACRDDAVVNVEGVQLPGRLLNELAPMHQNEDAPGHCCVLSSGNFCTIAAMIAAAMTVFPAPVGATRRIRRRPSATSFWNLAIIADWYGRSSLIAAPLGARIASTWSRKYADQALE